MPLGVLAAPLSLRLLPESHGASERLDLTGVGLVTGGVVALVWALTRANDIGWTNAETVIVLAAGGILLAAFLAWESRASEPMVPLRLFAVRAFAIGNLTSFLMSGAIFAAAFFVTQEFQFARGYSPLGTGLRLLPFFATPMFISPLAGALSDRVGRRPIMVGGLTLQALGFIWVAARGSLGTSWIELTGALLVAGIGISMALPTVPTAVLSAVAPEEMGKASGINSMAQRFGAVFAIAIGSAVFSAYGDLGTPASVTAGFQAALWACAAFATLAAVSALGITARKPATANNLRPPSCRSPRRACVARPECARSAGEDGPANGTARLAGIALSATRSPARRPGTPKAWRPCGSSVPAPARVGRRTETRYGRPHRQGHKRSN